MMTFAGIDPGKDGALFVIHPAATPLCYSTPTIPGVKGKRFYDERKIALLVRKTIDIAEDSHSILFVVERVHAMPGQGVTSMFSMGYGLGLWIGILAALKLSYELVTPQRWKSVMLDGTKRDKGAAVARASNLYPGVAFTTPRGRLLDGLADAALLAEYGRRIVSVPTTLPPEPDCRPS